MKPDSLAIRWQRTRLKTLAVRREEEFRQQIELASMREGLLRMIQAHSSKEDEQAPAQDIVVAAPQICEIETDTSEPVDEEDRIAREEQALVPLRRVRSLIPDPAPRLGDIAPSFGRPRAEPIERSGNTEELLNGLIAECHLLMRAVTLPSAMRADDTNTRVQFLNSAMRLAKTGAKVGGAVAKLRGAGAISEIRQRHIMERVTTTTPAPVIENEVRT